ncbi:MAG: UDP-3-O-(3-hydroxymyristoyl)glucosamine N-acyltransferase [Robiginitomaculum sp.]|nr:MAG: UDP-3-O-(3-hydroxymyristoyl)glucosamine N-acyltransferase [Robiginitomaculum sp.]
MVDTRFYKHLGPVSLALLLDGLDVELAEAQFWDILIESAAPVDQAGVADISYFESGRGRSELASCGASACFVREENAEGVSAHGCFPIISKYPRADFARVLGRLYHCHEYGPSGPVKFQGVHLCGGVVVGAGAKIGVGTILGPNSVIGPGVVIGENCKIGANVVIEYAVLGSGCEIQHGAVIGGSGFGVAVSAKGGIDIPHLGRVVIGDNVSVGCQSTIDRAVFGDTKIGSGCKFDNMVHIAHNTSIGPNCMFAAMVGIAGSCDIGAGVIMGGKAGLSDHLSVGDGATLAAGALPMHDVPAGEMWSGIPAFPIREHMRQISAMRKLGAKTKPASKPGAS